MKKAVSVVFAALFAATCMCGCGKSTTSGVDYETEQPVQPQQQIQQDNNDNDEKSKIEIIFDGNRNDGFHGEIRSRGALSGTRKYYRLDRSGNYTVEYIHAPYGIDKDTTLDYNLTLNNDNTFELTVVSDGVTANHNGHWYERRNEILLFYDEPIDPPQHNVYVADSLYCDILPRGKIMIYDNCHTIVLSRKITESAATNG